MRTTDNEIILDTTGKKNGRGAYVCCSECLAKAVKNKGLSRSLNAEIPDEVYEKLREAFAELER